MKIVKKVRDFILREEYILLPLLLIGILSFFLFKPTVEANFQYPVLDFSDINKEYTFENVSKYGELDQDGYELTKEGNDYILKLKNAKIGKLVLPMDVADKNCSLTNCGVKPRESNVTVYLYGNNLIQGYHQTEDGIVGQYVKKTTFLGNGSLTVNSTHGISIYSDVVFENSNITVNSKLYGINTNHSLTINGGKYKISSHDSSLIAADHMILNNTVVDADVYPSNGSYIKATKAIIEGIEDVNINGSTLMLKQGPGAIYGQNITISDSTINDNGKVTFTDNSEEMQNLKITEKANIDSGITAMKNLKIENTNIDLYSQVRALKAYGDLTISGGTMNLVSNERRASTLEGGPNVLFTGNTVVNVKGLGYGITSAHDYGNVTFDSGTKIRIYINGVVADKSSVDQYAISADNTYIGKNVDFEAFGPNCVFRNKVKFTEGFVYIEAGKWADARPFYRYVEPIAKEKMEMFHSEYRYVKLSEIKDEEAPTIGIVEDKYGYSMPVVTVKDNIGIDSITVNGSKIKSFQSDTSKEKKFLLPVLTTPTKEIIAVDVLGNKTTKTYTDNDFTKATVTLDTTSYQYDGKEKKPTVTVKYGTKKLKVQNEYTVQYKNNKEPGEASVIVTGKIGYSGVITKTFTIEKEKNTISASNINKTYMKKDQTVMIQAKQKGTAGLSYSSNNKNVQVDNSGKVTVKSGYVGTATVTIKASETEKYQSTTKNISVTVKKANNSITASNVTKIANKKNQAFTLKVKQAGNAKLTYSSNNKYISINSKGVITIKASYIGKATITITANANTTYNKAVKKITVVVNPITNQIAKLTNQKGKKMVVTLKRDTMVTGYQVQYTTDSKFKKSVKTVTLKRNNITATTISKLVKGKNYYVRIRSYKTVSKVNYYSGWSKVKYIKIVK